MHVPRWAEPAGRSLLRARVHATGAVWPALRRIPGSSMRLGPPRRFSASMAEWASGHPEVVVEVVDPTETWMLPLPDQQPGTYPDLFPSRRDQFLFETWRALIPGGRVYGSDATVIGHDDTVFGELLNSWPKSYEHHAVLRRVRLPPPRRVSGRVAVLGTLFGNSYYHWLVDVLPRLRLLGDGLRDADWIVVPSSQRFQQESLRAAGVPMERLIEPTRSLHLVADELLVPSLVPRVSQHTLPYLESLFVDGPSQARPFRRLYVTRATARRRRVTNEQELVDALGALGFETVDMGDRSVAEQALLFSEAEIVVGPHGGALTNIVFSRPGVRLVELCNADYVISAFWELVARAGGDYNLLMIPSPPTSSQWRDIRVPVDRLLTMLAEHGIG